MAAQQAAAALRNLAADLRARAFSLTPLTVLLALLCAVFAFVVGWSLVVDDPLGGQPRTVVSLDQPGDRAGGGNAAPDIRTGDPAQGGSAPEGQVTVLLPGDMPGGGVIVSDPISGAIDGDRDLVEESRNGLLPKIGADGRRPLQAYARPAPPLASGQPRIALVVAGLGLSAAGTENAIRRLPPEVTFAFAPYGRDLRRLARVARTEGHELLLQVPLEPYDYPDNDPGPHTLLSSLPERQNIDRLQWTMARLVGYVGVMNHMGAKFLTDETALRPVLNEIRNRGILYLEDGAAPQSRSASLGERIGLSQLAADKVIDAVATRDAIDAALADLMEIAADRGYAIGVASALPGTIAALEDWISVLEQRKIAIVPLTALLKSGPM